MVRKASLYLAAASLIVCLAAPALYFLGRLSEPQYKMTVAAATAGWFVFALIRATRGKKTTNWPSARGQ